MTTDISVGVRWDPLNGQPDSNGAGNGQIEDFDFEYDGGNSSSRLFERSRIRALAGENTSHYSILLLFCQVSSLHTDNVGCGRVTGSLCCTLVSR